MRARLAPGDFIECYMRIPIEVGGQAASLARWRATTAGCQPWQGMCLVDFPSAWFLFCRSAPPHLGTHAWDGRLWHNAARAACPGVAAACRSVSSVIPRGCTRLHVQAKSKTCEWAPRVVLLRRRAAWACGYMQLMCAVSVCWLPAAQQTAQQAAQQAVRQLHLYDGWMLSGLAPCGGAAAAVPALMTLTRSQRVQRLCWMSKTAAARCR